MRSAKGLKLVCIGGGHGLGRLLQSLKEVGSDLTGIVATTDEGGSTGRLREEADTIAWGDLRNCLVHLCPPTHISKLLFDYRFRTQGDLDGHSLGNLVLFALDQMSLRPTDAIGVMSELLRIESHILPMSDLPTTLMAETAPDQDKNSDTLVGELVIDESEDDIDRLWLEPAVHAETEVISKIDQADTLILSAGSFLTSIMPSLLVPDIADAINRSTARLIMVANLKEEGQTKALSFDQQIDQLEKAGIRMPDIVLWPSVRPLITDNPRGLNIEIAEVCKEGAGMHDTRRLRKAILTAIGTADSV